MEEEETWSCVPPHYNIMIMQCPATPAPAFSQHVCAVAPPPVLQYTNPLLFHNSTIFPPFDAIHALHIVPGIRTLLHHLVSFPSLPLSIYLSITHPIQVDNGSLIPFIRPLLISCQFTSFEVWPWFSFSSSLVGREKRLFLPLFGLSVS